MSNPKKLGGHWRIFGARRREYRGILSEDEKGVMLEVEEPTSSSIDDLMKKQLAKRLPVVSHIIHGKDDHDRPITLFGCISQRSFSASRIFHRISLLTGVEGIRAESWEAPIIRRVCLKLEYLNQWFGHPILQPVVGPDGKAALVLPPDEEQLLTICDDMKIRFVCRTVYSQSAEQWSFSPRCEVYLYFDKPQSLQSATREWVPWVTRFFSLLIGTGIRCVSTEVSATPENSSSSAGFADWGRMLERPQRAGKRNEDIGHVLVRYAPLRAKFELLLQRWHSVTQRMGPVVDLFSTVVFHQKLYAQAQFLFLTHALEVYHSLSAKFRSKRISGEKHAKRVDSVVSSAPRHLQKWVHRQLQSANFKHLDDRLLEVFQANRKEAVALYGRIKKTANQIAHTRNYFTHYTMKKKAGRFLNFEEMTRINHATELFLWILLLKELGIGGGPIEWLLSEGSTAVFVNLTGVARGSKGKVKKNRKSNKGLENIA